MNKSYWADLYVLAVYNKCEEYFEQEMIEEHGKEFYEEIKAKGKEKLKRIGPPIENT